MTYLRIFGAVFALFAAFLFGLSLTWRDFPGNPTGFPLNRTFVAVAFNGVRFDYERMPQLPVFEVRRTPLMRYRASRERWMQRLEQRDRPAAGSFVAWKDISVTARACRATRYRGAVSEDFASDHALAYGGWHTDSRK